jgi:hypothetical protein
MERSRHKVGFKGPRQFFEHAHDPQDSPASKEWLRDLLAIGQAR